MFNFIHPYKKHSRGQSFVELTLVLGLLLMLLAAVVEFGMLINQYISLVEGSREAARFGSVGDPFDPTGSGITNADFYGKVSDYIVGTNTTLGVIEPVHLKPELNDDVVISVFGARGNSLVRFPTSAGWSKFSTQTSKFTNAEISARMDATAPNTGILLVEIFYHYEQILKLPFLTQFVGDPISVYTYSIMPLPLAEPTSTPSP
ncbi:MAG: hypothetical protein CO094_13255 [Anaerolineae bacterium CG_4_9_14_3_um_filter_57_17]|nr:hypothetical protein [bacterium]NCT19764.1 hypothetical protein [bacterium]OIO84327.1 MAG: hypothetical protein AUK01_09785 [Anaerolineae bacterium CG2_30_57_67]PJB64407.1 MAG: hypothetical protein CO094_13255 [Anaerolineae bacterium CG_4_9_14_3_um_filter_57_17]